MALMALPSCDYISDPVQEPNGGGNGGEGVLRRVLLEDLTGHLCNNCPAAAQIALQLQGIYGSEELVLVGVHTTDFFAAPADPPNPNGSYSTDFRTPAGDTYGTTFNVAFLPAGLVSRKEFNSSLTLSSSSWGSAVADIIGRPADMEVLFDTVVFNAGTNTVQTDVKVALVNSVNANVNLTVYLTEDHVVDWQLDSQSNPPDVEFYDHRHVLRGNLNGTWGTSLFTGIAAAGDTLSASFSYTLPPNVLVPANCSLVAYVYDTDTFEVLQVREVHMVP